MNEDKRNGKRTGLRTNAFLDLYPPGEQSWSGKVSFSLSYPHAGWITLTVSSTAYIQTVHIDCSHVFDPFPNFLEWLGKIATGNLPCECSIDEEGHGKTFRAKAVNDEDLLLTITPIYWRPREGEEEEPLYLYTVASRKQVVADFLRCWDDFITNHWDQNEWESRDLSALDVSALRKH